jgi:glycosyltransferase involved in cell wall biosynthesis
MNQKRFRLGYLVSHPIQYQVPMLRHIARDPEIDLRVFYMSDMSVQGFEDPGFGVTVKWDVPLLGGYSHEFLPRIGDRKVTPLFRPFVVGLESVLRRERLDALWLHGYKHQACLRAIFAARRLRIRTLVRGESNDHGTRVGARKRVHNQVLRSLFQRIDAFLFIGQLNREFYRNLGVGEAKLFSMPYSVDNTFFQAAVKDAAAARNELRESLNIPPGSGPIILYAAKLVPWKRPFDLLEAYSRVASSMPGNGIPYLVYVGDGQERKALERRIGDLGLKTVRLLGFKNQTELPRYYDLCDVFVLPSDREPWGLVVNEVMNAGKPVIVTRTAGCAPDLVRDGENGFVVPVGDVDLLASKLRQLIQDADLRSKMGEAGKQLVSKFSYENDLLGLKQALHQVCRSTAS